MSTPRRILAAIKDLRARALHTKHLADFQRAGIFFVPMFPFAPAMIVCSMSAVPSMGVASSRQECAESATSSLHADASLQLG